MDNTVESENLVLISEKNDLNNLKNNKNQKSHEATEEKHGVYCKININSTEGAENDTNKNDNNFSTPCDKNFSNGDVLEKIVNKEKKENEENTVVNDSENKDEEVEAKITKNNVEEPNNNNDETKNSITNDPFNDTSNNSQPNGDQESTSVDPKPNTEGIEDILENGSVDQNENEKDIFEKDEEENEDDVKLFDYTDLPLKVNKKDSRGRKRKAEDNVVDKWDRVGKISGKIFDEDDDDDLYDYRNNYDYDGEENDEYNSFKQASLAKKTSSNDRVWTDISKSAKKMKTESFIKKFIKTPTASEKKKSNETSKNVKSEKTKAQLNRKENWLCSWEKKLMGVENELEARVGWIKKTEGKIMREERRLAEKEALLNYREQLLMNVPLDNDEGVKKILEEAMKRLKEFARWIDEQGSTFEKNGSKEVELETTNTPTLSSGADFADDVK